MRLLKHTLTAMACATAITMAASTPSQTLRAAADKIHSAPTWSVTYTYTSATGATAGGAMTISGKRFAIANSEIAIWYDGTTQWTLDRKANEVSITEPTAAEVRETNPMALIDNLDASYTLRSLPSKKGQENIEVTPKSGAAAANFKKAIITIDSNTSLPTAITITPTSGHDNAITISSIKTGKPLSVNAFRFWQKDYPGVSVNDLR